VHFPELGEHAPSYVSGPKLALVIREEKLRFKLEKDVGGDPTQARHRAQKAMINRDSIFHHCVQMPSPPEPRRTGSPRSVCHIARAFLVTANGQPP
jgi:hypothetical protein